MELPATVLASNTVSSDPDAPAPLAPQDSGADATVAGERVATPPPEPAAAAAAPRTILVLGATGRQGGAVIDALLARATARPWRIVALTRNPASPAARALAARGLALAAVNANKRATLDAALAAHAPVHAFFAVTNPFSERWAGGAPPAGDTALEVVQGRNCVDACKAAGVAHFVLTSVASAGDCTVDGAPIETFHAKWLVERHLAASGLPHTIIAPTGFFENMSACWGGRRRAAPPPAPPSPPPLLT